MIEIPLTRGLIALVDDCNAHFLDYNWQAIAGWKSNTYYAKRDDEDKSVLMHRLVMGMVEDTDRNMRVHHIDGNGLNNQKINLEIVSTSFNTFMGTVENPRSNNKTGVTGVHWSSQKGKWQAELKFNGIRYHLGFFNNFDAAVAARKNKEKELCP